LEQTAEVRLLAQGRSVRGCRGAAAIRPVDVHAHARRTSNIVSRAGHKEHLRGVEGEALKRHPIRKRIGLVCARLFGCDHELEAARAERGEASELTRAVGPDVARIAPMAL